MPKGIEPGLEATKFYDPYFGTASNATHVAVVEIDPAAGKVVGRDPVRGQPIGVAVDDRAVWASALDAGVVARLPR